MTANVLEHRRAKAFAEALEAHRTGQPANRAVLGQLLDTAEALTALAAPAMDAEVKTVQRAQLLAAFEQVTAGGGLGAAPRQRRHRAERVGQRRRWGRRFAITGLVAGVTVGSFAGVATASSGALPGDPLYGMKRGLEGLRLDLAGSDSERGELLLDQASTRLAEARSLVGRGGGPGGLSPSTVARLNSALKDMHAEAAKGRDLLRSVYQANGSLDPMRKLADFTEAQDSHWSALQPRLPAQLTPVAGQVDQLFGALNEDMAQAHLDPVESGPATPAATGSPTAGERPGTPRPGAGAPSGEDGHPATAPSGGNRTGGEEPSTGGGAPAPSTGGGSAATPGSPLGGGNPVSGLVNGLTGPLTGSGATPAAPAPSGSPALSPAPGNAPAPGGTAAAPGQGSSTPPAVQGLNLPPLIPGLLPGLGLDGN
ncbi:DUF5667 domain-containing protein [Kitasatospora sp. NBC_01287]|uniref:DUF5667 domain-containing protein n=1 Tax=Kitasatospora sp. NBC_01287 TaxID=2903573 RepID=UPI002251AE18|nr:DUF5667 domain-containing protein [Kitasatospora sp. NBC_01287]MCX4748334.1 DUF5667 domain-containing protein [Kitasatospora sp. NBC_01287]